MGAVVIDKVDIIILSELDDDDDDDVVVVVVMVEGIKILDDDNDDKGVESDKADVDVDNAGVGAVVIGAHLLGLLQSQGGTHARKQFRSGVVSEYNILRLKNQVNSNVKLIISTNHSCDTRGTSPPRKLSCKDLQSTKQKINQHL